MVLPFTVTGRSRPANVTDVPVALTRSETFAAPIGCPIVPAQAPENFAVPLGADAGAELERAGVFAVLSGSDDFALSFAEFFFGLACASGVAVGDAGTGVAGGGVGEAGA